MVISKHELRKQAYQYILERLTKLQIDASGDKSRTDISLDEIKLLKEGMTDPSVSLVATLKRLLKGIVSESEIEPPCKAV